MTLIHVPRPNKKQAMNPGRAVSALLKMQIQHLHHAERNLPLRYRTDIYTHAIKTEGQAAQYIGQATAAIHKAHEQAAAKLSRGAVKSGRAARIAAAAERPPRKPGKTSKPKKKHKGNTKRSRKA